MIKPLELNQKLKMTRGDTASWSGQVKDPDLLDVNGNPTPKNIQGAALTFTVKKDIEDPDSSAVFQKTVGNGITIPVGNLTGMFTIGPLTSADTTSLPNETIGLVFDVQMVLAGNKSTVAAGTLTVRAEGTQS